MTFDELLAHVLELLQRGADAEGPADLRFGHGLADLGQLGDELGKAQVAVGIDEHGSSIVGARAPGLTQ